MCLISVGKQTRGDCSCKCAGRVLGTEAMARGDGGRYGGVRASYISSLLGTRHRLLLTWLVSFYVLLPVCDIVSVGLAGRVALS
jgi:hypothetical protein